MARSLATLGDRLPVRFLTWGASALLMVAGVVCGLVGSTGWCIWLVVIGLPLTLLGLRDFLQTKKAVLRNYPVLGNLRYLLEFVRPEL